MSDEFEVLLFQKELDTGRVADAEQISIAVPVSPIDLVVGRRSIFFRRIHSGVAAPDELSEKSTPD